jgi:hypothetical protein
MNYHFITAFVRGLSGNCDQLPDAQIHRSACATCVDEIAFLCVFFQDILIFSLVLRALPLEELMHFLDKHLHQHTCDVRQTLKKSHGWRLRSQITIS